MSQTLGQRATAIRRADKIATYKKHITSLIEALDRQNEKTRAEEARADLAERQVRQVVAERDLWKHQAQEAQAKLKSLGVGP